MFHLECTVLKLCKSTFCLEALKECVDFLCWIHHREPLIDTLLPTILVFTGKCWLWFTTFPHPSIQLPLFDVKIMAKKQAVFWSAPTVHYLRIIPRARIDSEAISARGIIVLVKFNKLVKKLSRQVGENAIQLPLFFKAGAFRYI